MGDYGALAFTLSYLPFPLAYVVYLGSGGTSRWNLRHRPRLRLWGLLGFLVVYYLALSDVQYALGWALGRLSA